MRVLRLAIAGLLIATFAVSASAAAPNIGPGYYRKYSCDQLLEEGRRVSAQAVLMANDHNDARVDDTASTEDIIVIPKVFLGSKPASGGLAILKQKLSAIEDATIQSQCQIEFRGSGS